MKKLQESDLQIGDILIFEDFDFNPEKKEKLEQDIQDILDDSNLSYLEKLNKIYSTTFNSLLHYLIAWFDPGKEGNNYRNIYHAGIWGNVNINRDKKLPPKFENCIVQAGGNGISCSSLRNNLEHQQVMKIYVCRLKEKGDDFENKITASIRDFYKNKGHYSNTTAWLLALICSLRYSKGTLHTLLEQKFGLLKADLLVYGILNLINSYNNNHQRNMIACSTLVAMMYKNAGYELPVDVFQGHLLQNELPKPNFDLKNITFDENMVTSDSSDKWPQLKEIIVTPRQLMESEDVKVVGYFEHIDS
ncbi:hypothetical protein [Polaribacter porphyrae]|uniref:Uncharacterized protein n=1 Tax=Polaribacter porphyrae TaxID=1137780 RepID=A0A2S7WT10_9FLAO|nr:hypothetical protein [Polaribacter porphyrae]PQJ80737.1 hypothetical protein BTO18_16855 [Polaribacter porphyrae]